MFFIRLFYLLTSIFTKFHSFDLGGLRQATVNKDIIPWVRDALGDLNSMAELAAFKRAYDLWLRHLHRVGESALVDHFDQTYGSTKWSHAWTFDVGGGGVPSTNNGIERLNRYVFYLVEDCLIYITLVMCGHHLQGH